MPADIVNLNKFRKAKAREDDEKRAEVNRAKFGRTKPERTKDEDERARRNTLLDGAKRENPGNAGPNDEPSPDPEKAT